MALIDRNDFITAGRRPVLNTLADAWRGFVRHREDHRALADLARKPPRLLCDIGFDPKSIYAAGDTAWDDIERDPSRGLRLDPPVGRR